MSRLGVAALLVILALPALVRPQERIPPECYLDQKANTLNTCKYCHTSNQPGALNNDIDRQSAFSPQENRFLNVLDPGRLDQLVPPETIPADLRGFLALDNYAAALQERGGTAEVGSGRGVYKYFPDLDPAQTGSDGFANNGWRAWKWKPNQLAWPRFNGRIQQNWVRLADKFQRNAAGAYDLEIYRQNLDLVIEVVRGAVTNGTYRGLAADEQVVPYRFPAGTEILHYLYYLDPSRSGMKATRIKEVRWNLKTVPLAYNQSYFNYVSPKEKEYSLTWLEGGPDPAAAYGLAYNGDGWDLVGFIESPDGTLRPQSQQEMTQCLGCHSGRIGIPVDSHWHSLQRQIPGAAGWSLQDYQGIYDYYNAGLGRAEMAETFVSIFGSASGLQGNADGTIDYLPTPADADALTRRYYQIVQTQSFALGRDPVLKADPGMQRQPATTRFRPQAEQQAWYPALDFARFDPVAPATAVTGEAEVLPRATRLYPNHPNPFNGGTQVRFSLADAGPTTLAVYSLNGQRIRLLADGQRAAGTWSMTWDGRDDLGRPCASGTYVIQLVAGGQVVSRKALILR